MLSPILEETEREKCFAIRQELKNLAIKHTRPKERELLQHKRTPRPETVFNPPTEGLELKVEKWCIP